MGGLVDRSRRQGPLPIRPRAQAEHSDQQPRRQRPEGDGGPEQGRPGVRWRLRHTRAADSSNGNPRRGLGKLYLHVFNWPADGTLTVPGYTDHVTRAYLMANPKTDLTMKTNAGGLLIQVPSSAPDPIATVIVLEVAR